MSGEPIRQVAQSDQASWSPVPCRNATQQHAGRGPAGLPRPGADGLKPHCVDATSLSSIGRSCLREEEGSRQDQQQGREGQAWACGGRETWWMLRLGGGCRGPPSRAKARSSGRDEIGWHVERVAEESADASGRQSATRELITWAINPAPFTFSQGLIHTS